MSEFEKQFPKPILVHLKSLWTDDELLKCVYEKEKQTWIAALKWALSCKSTYEDCNPWNYIDTEVIEQELEVMEND